MMAAITTIGVMNRIKETSYRLYVFILINIKLLNPCRP